MGEDSGPDEESVYENKMTDMKRKPVVSVITAVKNASSILEGTIRSVLEQDYPNIEYIVIDGGSNDGTVDLIRKYQDRIAFWVSEHDKGISDAFNKGVKASKGDYLYFLGAGDQFVSKDPISKMMEGVDPENDLLVCGKIQRVDMDESSKVIYVSSGKFSKVSLLFRMSLPHQALFMNKKYFERYDSFRTDLKFAMDYELLLRSYKEFPGVMMKDIIVSKWRAGGIGADRTLEIYDEYLKIKLMNKVASVAVLVMIDKWNRLKYFLKKVLRKT